MKKDPAIIESKEETTPWEDISATWELCKSGRMVMCMPIICWTGFSIGIFGSVFVPLITRTIEDGGTESSVADYQALYTMTMLGAGEIIGGQFLGWIRDYSSTKTAAAVLIIETCIAYAFLIWYNERNVFDWLAYVFVFLWGIQDSGLNCIVRSILGFEFDSKIVPFSVFNFL